MTFYKKGKFSFYDFFHTAR